MRIVVLAGGTSTERDVSIVSGTGICNGLREKGHNAVLIDVFCGIKEVNWEDPSLKNMMWRLQPLISEALTRI